MEDVIFSGTSNKPSKNIAEVSVTVENKNNEGPIQFRELNEINVRRKIEKTKDQNFTSMIKRLELEMLKCSLQIYLLARIHHH